MVIYCNRHYFLGIILSHNIFIKLSFNLMRRNNVLNINYRLIFLFIISIAFCFGLFFGLILFPLNLLRIRHTKISKINHANIRHLAKIKCSSSILLSIIEIIHRIKSSLHALITNTHSTSDINHRTRCTLCSMTDKADILIFAFLFVILFV